jgi:hypothetical protein
MERLLIRSIAGVVLIGRLAFAQEPAPAAEEAAPAPPPAATEAPPAATEPASETPAAESAADAPAAKPTPERKRKKAAPKQEASAPVAPPAQANTPAPVPGRVANEEFSAEVLTRAKVFFASLILQDIAKIVSASAVPFMLEDKTLNSEAALSAALVKALEAKNTHLLSLQNIEILTPTEMEKKYGPPPARLAKVPWNKPHTLIAVANISGHAAVAVFQQTRTGWKAVAFHD